MEEALMGPRLRKTLARVSEFYDARKVGDGGALGFRRSTDLSVLAQCADTLIGERILATGESRFLDLGCADGRVNLFMSYLVRTSVGVEMDEWTLEEYGPLREDLERLLAEEGLAAPPGNVHLFHGDSTDRAVHERIRSETGVALDRVDIFYTYLVMDREFSELIRARGRKGAVFMVYGLDRILPRYEGFRHLDRISPLGGRLALYEKL